MSLEQMGFNGWAAQNYVWQCLCKKELTGQAGQVNQVRY